MEDRLQVAMMSDFGYLAMYDGIGMVKYKVDERKNLVELKPTNFFTALDRPSRILILAQIVAYLDEKKTSKGLPS